MAGPDITITSPTAINYPPTGSLSLDFTAVDVGVSGLKSVWADLDGVAAKGGTTIDLSTLSNGLHTLTVHALDFANNESVKTVTFGVKTVAPVANLPAITTTMKNPKFTWTPVADQTKYEIKLFTQAGTLVKTMLIDTPACGPLACSYTPSPALALANGAYKWKVRSFNEVWSDFSLIKTFTKYDAPAPITPTGTISVGNPLFTWVKIPGVTKYNIELKRATDGIVRLITVNAPVCDATTCSFKAVVPLNLMAHATFQWRVRAFHGYYGPFSAWMFFNR